ncbi:hypothetical protein [Fibrella forsythiae]|uniref:AsmA-like C-terminal domain-containing protein n=1 Tax=Fibrella forsythiae TaxID=2817061 RepID=A0ABS3JLJ9_9BACT|nr:hypothetical protein [Fibrella forsythiae]MBO0950880.1 hypothetical protein [Fibrella forsythiae]
MQGPQRQYTNEMHRKFGFFAIFTPGTPLALGDIGTFDKNQFKRISSLKEKFGIEPKIRLDTTREDIDYQSEGSVTISAKLSGVAALPGSALRDIDAGIIVEFNKENSTVFRAKGVLTHSIEDTISLGEQIVQLFKDSKWDKSWTVITELIVADSATILISQSADSKIELKATAQVDAADFDIADASLDFKAVFQRSLETNIVAKSGLTPLFRTMKIKTPIFSKPKFKTLGVDKQLDDNITSIDLLTPSNVDSDFKESLSFGFSDFDQETLF